MIDATKYHFDPKLDLKDIGKAQALERLRWIPDRAQAQHMADLWDSLPRNEPRVRELERSKSRERRDRLIKVAEASKRGDHGEPAKELAHEYFNLEPSRADLPRLEAYLTALQKLNIDVHSMPSRRAQRGGGFRES